MTNKIEPVFITMIPQRNTLFTGLSMEENIIYGTNSTTEDVSLLLSGTGDVIESDDGILAIGSGDTLP